MFTNFEIMKQVSRVQFFYEGVRPRITGVGRLKSDIEKLFRREGRALERIVYIFCSDQQLLSINQQYLNHQAYTDIITFDLSESEATVGEVYISWERVRENALAFKEPISRELRRVIFHGALHLCGYKDKKPSEERKMREMEQFYLSRFGY